MVEAMEKAKQMHAELWGPSRCEPVRFTAAAAKVVLGVETDQFNRGLRNAEGEFHRAVGGMGAGMSELQERQLRASVAADKYTNALRRYGPASMQARTALASLASEQRKVAAASERGAHAAGQFERGMLRGALSTHHFGHGISLVSNAFLGGTRPGRRDRVGGARGDQVPRLDDPDQHAGRRVDARGRADVEGGDGPRAEGRDGPNELATGLYHVESAGLRGAKALEVLRAAAKGAQIGHADLESVTNALIAANRSGIRGVGDMSAAMGQLNAIVGTGNMRMEDLSQSLSSGVLSSARGFGLSLRDVGSALATLTDAGVPPSRRRPVYV